MLSDDMLHLLRQMVRQAFDCYVTFRWIENRQVAFSVSGRVKFLEAESAVKIEVVDNSFCNDMYLRQCSRRFVLAIIHNHFKVEIAAERSDILTTSAGVEIIATDLQPIKQSDLRRHMRVKGVGESESPLMVEDISLGGLCIVDRRGHIKAKLGDKVELMLEINYLRMKPRKIAIKGILKRCNERKNGMEWGLEFSEMKDDIQFWIQTFIQSQLRAQANHEVHFGVIRVLELKTYR